MKKGSDNWILLIWPCTREKGSWWSSWHITAFFLYNVSMTNFLFVLVISSLPFCVHMSSPVVFLKWGSDLVHLPKHSKKQIPVLCLWSLGFLGGIILDLLSGYERNCLFRFILCYWNICAVVRKPAIGIYTEKVFFASLFSQINTVINSVIFWAFSNPILSEWHPDG